MELSFQLPPKLNAAAVEPLRELLQNPPQRGVLTLRAASPTCFCDGMDVRGALVSDSQAMLETLSDTFALLTESPLPTLALVQGSARGGGVGLAAACDVVIAERGATFALPELLFGLVPATIWPILEQRVNVARLRRWALTAATVNLEEATQAGLVDVVAEPGTLERCAKQQLRALGRVRSEAVQRLRRLLPSNANSVADRVRAGGRVTATLLDEPDVARAMEAFERGEAPWLD